MPNSKIPTSWRSILADETSQPYFKHLQEFVAAERETHEVYPPEKDVYNALEITSLDATSVLLLGQDPYHGKGQAHGLCFSVRPGVKPPPSLMNIFKEMHADVGVPIPDNGYLVPWAEQGILMLNAVLTVRAGEPNSHKGKGWEKFTDAIIRKVNEKDDGVVFVLWGGYAGKKLALIDTAKHRVISSAHPSPLSAHNGFFGSRPFSKINDALRELGKPVIDWRIADINAKL
jgi:uracil-DNA glycosylase